MRRDLNRVRRPALVLTLAGALALPLVAQAAHWPGFGGDAGHSGNQPVDPASMTVRHLYRHPDPGMPVTSLVVSGGDATSGRRLSYGRFLNPQGADDETRIHIRDLRTGAEKVPDAQQPIDDDTTGDGETLGSDDITLGTPDRQVTPVSSSGHGGTGQLYVVHNDADQPAAAGNGCAGPLGSSASNNDISIAQFDEATGEQKRDVAIGQARGAGVAACPNVDQPTDGYIVESAPVLTPPLDDSGKRVLFFVARYAGTGAQQPRLFRLEIENAASPASVIKTTTVAYRDLPGLNTQASPAIAYLRSPETGASVPYVIVALNATPGGSDVRAFRVDDISAGAVDLEAPADIPGNPVAISVPVTEDGELPGPPSGEDKAPAIYVTYRDGEATRVHRLVQTGNSEQLGDAAATPAALDGTPGRAPALSQVVSGGQEQEGRVIVSTSMNLYALDRSSLAIVERFRDPGESTVQFSRNAPLTSGGFVFIQDDKGFPYVLDLDDLEPVAGFEFTPEATHAESTFGSGQPSYSAGLLSWATDRGTYTYETGVSVPSNQAPVARFTPTPNPASPGQPVTLDASASSDPEGAGIARYEWDLDGNGTYEVDRGADPKLTTSFAAPGTYTVGLRVTDVAQDGRVPQTATTSGQIVVIAQAANRRPTAAFTATPDPAARGRRVTFSAAASRDEDGTITRYEWDLDGDGSFETSGTGAQAQRTYTRAGTVTVRLRVTDNAGGTAEAQRSLTVRDLRRTPRGLSLRVTPARDARRPHAFRSSGTLARPSGVSRARACTGRVTVVVKAGKKTVSRRTTRLRSTCRYRVSVRFGNRKRLGKARTLRFRASFQGNGALRARRSKEVRARVR